MMTRGVKAAVPAARSFSRSYDERDERVRTRIEVRGKELPWLTRVPQGKALARKHRENEICKPISNGFVKYV